MCLNFVPPNSGHKVTFGLSTTQNNNTLLLSTCQAPTRRGYELQLAWSLWTDTADGKQRGVQLVLHRWASVKWWGAPRRPPRAVHTLCSNIRSHYMEFWHFWWGLSVTKRRPDWKVLKKLYNWWQITMWKEWHFPKDFRVPSSTVLQLLRTEPQHSGLQVVGHSARVVHMAGSQYTCVSNGTQWDTQVVIIWSPMNY